MTDQGEDTWVCQICKGYQDVKDTSELEIVMGWCHECLWQAAHDTDDPLYTVTSMILEMIAKDSTFALSDDKDRARLTDLLITGLLLVNE